MEVRSIVLVGLLAGAAIPMFSQVRGRASASAVVRAPGFVQPGPAFSPGPVIVGGPPVIVGGPRVIVGGPPVIVSGPPVIVRAPSPIVGGPPVIVGGPAPIVRSSMMGRPVPPPRIVAPPRPRVWIPGQWVRRGNVTRYVPGHFQ